MHALAVVAITIALTPTSVYAIALAPTSVHAIALAPATLHTASLPCAVPKRSAPVALSALPDSEEVVRPLSLLITAQFILFIGVGAVVPVLPLYGKSIGLSSAVNGVVLSAPAVALLVGARPAGQFADRSRKPAMMYGMALIALADLGTSTSLSLVPLVFSRLGLGAGRCVAEAGERGMLADLAGRVPSLRGRSLAAQQAVAALGIAVGAPLGGMVVEQYGPRAAFLCVTSAALVTLSLYSLLPETREQSGFGNAASGTPATQDKQSALWAKLLDDTRWRGLCVCECGARFGFAAKIASVPVLAAAVLGGAANAGFLLSAAGLSGVLGATVGGVITDRAGAKTCALASGTVSGVALMFVPLALALPAEHGGSLPFDSGAAFALAVVLWSFGAAAQAPSLAAIGQELSPPASVAEALALPRAVGDAVYIVAPFLLGLVSDASPPSSGVECAVAGGASLLGVIALALI